MRFLIRTSADGTELKDLLIRASGEITNGVIYVEEIARRLGDVFRLITRDPITNATFHPEEVISQRTKELIARRWARVENVKDGDTKPLIERSPGFHEITQAQIDRKLLLINQMWDELINYGIRFRIGHRHERAI